jgi:uncharacterized protein YjeT (DUF2065 family)
MTWAFLALGLVLVVEGLVWALAPRMIEDLLVALQAMSIEARRLAGLAALSAGVALVWAARILGGAS